MTAAIVEPGSPGPIQLKPTASRWVVAPFAVAAIVSLPILIIAAHVFVPAGEVWRHLAATVLSSYVINTLWLLIGVGIGTLVIGAGTAWLCSMCSFPGRALFEWTLLLPLAVPTYAIGFTYAGLLDFAGPVQSSLRALFGWSRGDYWFPEIQSLGGVILVMSLVLYPYVYLLGRVAFLSQSACALEIGRTLGHGPWRGFARIALPLARPALAGGVALALMEAIADFGTVDYYGVDTFTTGIYRTWFGLGDPAAAAQLSAVLLGFVLLVLLGEEWSRRGRRFHHTSARYRPLPHHRLSGAAAIGALLACAAPLTLGFLLPGGVLLAWTIETAGEMIDARFVTLAWNSLFLALITAVLAVGVSLLVAFALRLSGGDRAPAPLRWAARVAGLGYAIPGSVIAVGVLLPSAAIDTWIDDAARSWFGVSTGLLLTGGIASLVFGYLVRFLAISLNAVSAAFGRVTPSMDGAARSLGAGPGRMLARVHAPLVSGGLLTAALLVFVDVMKELPATLILRPFNFDTLAVRAYELASDELLAESASAALAIVLVGLVPVILLSRAIARARPGGPTESGHGQGYRVTGLAFSGVSHAYGATVAVRDVSLDIPRGAVACLLGPSGCGKSTLLRLAAGLEQLQAGRIEILGEPVATEDGAIAPEDRRVGLMFQDFALFPHLDVLGNVCFGLSGLDAAARRERAAETLEQVGMAHAAAAYPHTLSGGEQQRVALARALAPGPRAMLLDEPFSSLDVHLRGQVRHDCLAALRETGTTTMIVTHEPEEAMLVADIIAVMRDGSLIQTATPEQLYCHPSEPFCVNLFGDTNELPGILKANAVMTALGAVPVDGAALGPHPRVFLRPEGVRVGSGEARAKVVEVRCLGAVSQVRLVIDSGAEAGPGTLTARVIGSAAPGVGDEVAVGLDPAMAFVFPTADR